MLGLVKKNEKRNFWCIPVRNMVVAKRVMHFSAEWLKNHHVLKDRKEYQKQKFISVWSEKSYCVEKNKCGVWGNGDVDKSDDNSVCR